MKKIFAISVLAFTVFACNSNNTEHTTNDTTNYGNAGMSGTLNANGFQPVDSNKTLNQGADSVHTNLDSTGRTAGDSTR